MKQTIKNKLIAIMGGAWLVIASIDTAGIVDLIPEDFQYKDWIKLVTALVVLLFGMYGFKKTPTEEVDINLNDKEMDEYLNVFLLQAQNINDGLSATHPKKQTTLELIENLQSVIGGGGIKNPPPA